MMIQIRNVTASVALSAEATHSAEGNNSPVEQGSLASVSAATEGTTNGSLLAILGNALAARALNPQPLPPREALRAFAEFEGNEGPPLKIPGDLGKDVEDALKRRLNARLATPSEINDPLAAAGLNPQPLPPRELMRSIRDPLTAAGLNPQPLPPRETLQDFDQPSQVGRIG